MVGIMDIFTGMNPFAGRAGQAGNSVAGGNTGTTPAVATPQQAEAQAAANGVPAAVAGTPAATPDGVKSPLDELPKVFTVADEKNAAAQAQNSTPQPQQQQGLFAWDAAKMQETVQKMSFVNQLPQEVLARAAQGDVEAFKQALNFVGQQAFYQGTQMNVNLMEQGINRSLQQFETKLPERFKTYQDSDVLSADPVLNHPEVRPVAEAMLAQLQTVYPNSSTEQRKTMVRDWLARAGNAVNPQQPAQQRSTGPGIPQSPAFPENFFSN